MDFVKQNFDKLVMLFLVLFFTGVTIHIMHDKGVDTAEIDWACGLVGGVVGSLTTLVVGKNVEAPHGNDNQSRP